MPFPLLLAAAVASALPLGELPQQVLGKDQCAMFLWDRASERRVAMVLANPLSLRVMRNGVATTLPASDAGTGAPVLGFPSRLRFADAGSAIAIDATIEPNDGGIGGVVRDAIITMTLPTGEAVVAPVAGLVGCG
ncbi:hypothetical protein [Sandarakinorhabdus sp. DWP1-3-1]|uniref:hypothetical protein n=1 Tax=Sandarakinorhabdus sp. DWP1-3-1 TaxID=2804627 RepID=UPI003CEF0F72